jgi:predicted protein tyrosine phosphatase
MQDNISYIIPKDTALITSTMTSLTISPNTSPLSSPISLSSTMPVQQNTALESVVPIILPPLAPPQGIAQTPTIKTGFSFRPPSLTLLQIPPKNSTFQKAITYDHDASLIFEYKGCKLYIGALEHSVDIKLHKEKNISAIVSALPEEVMLPCPEINSENYNLLRISVNDSRVNGLNLDHLKIFEDFINAQFEQGRNVLVHCHMGISRSVTLVISWIMKYFNLNDTEAMKLVVSKRPQASPNFHFCYLLMKYNNVLNGIPVTPGTPH